MSEPRIFLKETPCGSSYGYLIHEAAHWRHFELDMQGKNLSGLWQKEFPIVVPDGVALSGISPYGETAIGILYQNGIFCLHATLKLDKETPESRYGLPINLPDVAPVSKSQENSLTVEFYHPYEVPVSLIAFRMAYRCVAKLPDGLREYVNRVGIYPELNYPGVFSFPNSTPHPLYLSVCEDIATSTEHLTTASRNPRSHDFVYSQLANNPKTRRRLEALVEFGFVEKDTATRLMREAGRMVVPVFAEFIPPFF